VRETLNADIPLAADHFRYFAGCIPAQEGTAAEIDEPAATYHYHKPLSTEQRREGKEGTVETASEQETHKQQIEYG